jgi:hypothetical protein
VSVGSVGAPPVHEAHRRPALAAISIALGFALTTLYFVLSQLLPDTGASEFAYKPFMFEFQLFSAMRGFTFEQLTNHVLRVLVLGPGLILLSLGLARVLQLQATQLPRLHSVQLAASAASLSITAYVMVFVLRGRAITDDEITYAAMARSFTHGRLAEPAASGQLLDFFEVATKLGFTGKYLFGEPLVQMLGVLVSMPALMHLPLNALTLFALHRSVLLLWGERTLAAFSCCLLAISPSFVLCAATGLSQTASLSCVMLCILGYALAKQRGSACGGVLAGAALGFGLAVRMQSLAPVGVVIGAGFVLLALRTRNLRPLAGFVALSSLFIGLIALYNWTLSGDPLQLPWFLQAGTAERYGFVQVFPGLDFTHTPLGALQNLAVVAVRMNSWWLGWPLALLLVWRRSALQRLWREGAVVVCCAMAVTLFELGYYSTGVSDVGPIYHHELLPCLCILAALSLQGLWQQRPELVLTIVFVHVLFGTGSLLSEQTARLGRLTHAIYDEPERAYASLPGRALLLLEPECDGRAHLGWVYRPFPLVTHDPAARVVSYIRPRPRQLDAFIAQFPGRACYYLFGDRTMPCSVARNQLMAPLGKHNAAACVEAQPTAAKLQQFLAERGRPE